MPVKGSVWHFGPFQAQARMGADQAAIDVELFLREPALQSFWRHERELCC
jgi:hypothetical protein